MSKEIKKRLITSIFLIISFITIFFNLYLMLYALIVIYLFSLIEFENIISRIYQKNKLKKIIFNLLFLSYLSLFLTLFFLFSLDHTIKILIFFCLFICILSDIGGLVIGKLIKGPKLTRISPNKTVAGSVGSLIFSALSAVIFVSIFLNYSLLFKVISISIVISIFCQIGDLFFSKLKRKAKLKDTGNLLPGHGGILDRVDGMLLGLPCGLIFSSIILN